MSTQTDRRQVPIWLLLPAAGLAAWVIVSRCVATWPLDVHLRDDAYYYFAWARSLAAGQGPCVTPGVPTSGVHVLWAMMLASVAWIAGAAVLPAASVVIGLALHLATAWLIYRAAAPLSRVGMIAGCVYAGSSFLAVEAMNGQETGLACFGLALLCVVYRRGSWHFFWAGLVAVAARSDLFFFVVGLAMVEPKRRAARLAATAGIFACYAIWNFLLAGQWAQDSVRPIPWLMADEFAQGNGSYLDRAWQVARPVLFGTPFRNPSTAMALAWVIVAWLGLRRREAGFAWLLGAGLALVCCHYFWRFYPRDYYFAPLGVVGGLALVRLWLVVPRAGLLLVLLGLLWNGKHALDPQPVRNWQREMTMAGRFVAEFVPGERIGCFNSGIVTWEHRGAVVNLDGVVNAPAFAALERRDLLGYLREQGVHYLLDNPVQFERRGVHACGRHFGERFDAARDLRECIRFWWPADRQDRGRPGIGWFSLYRLRGEGRPPSPLVGAQDLGPAPGGRWIAWQARRGQRLRTGESPLVAAAADLVFVLQVPWDGADDLQFYVGDSSTPVLIIACR